MGLLRSFLDCAIKSVARNDGINRFMKYFVANWKANKDLEEAETWINILDNKLLFDSKIQSQLLADQLKIIIAPPFPFLPYFLNLISQFKKQHPYYKNINLASQDVSQFNEGSYTGEVTAKTLEGLVNYVIIGHSERRTLFNETNEIIRKKVEMAKKYNIEPVLCVRNKEDIATRKVNFITYEPVQAIGTGNNESLDNILKVKKELNLSEKTSFFYGGSVNQANIKTYLTSDEIKGFIVGTASLNPEDFFNI